MSDEPKFKITRKLAVAVCDFLKYGGSLDDPEKRKNHRLWENFSKRFLENGVDVDNMTPEQIKELVKQCEVCIEELFERPNTAPSFPKPSKKGMITKQGFINDNPDPPRER